MGWWKDFWQDLLKHGGGNTRPIAPVRPSKNGLKETKEEKKGSDK